MERYYQRKSVASDTNLATSVEIPSVNARTAIPPRPKHNSSVPELVDLDNIPRCS